MTSRPFHDLGGQPAGPVDTVPHDPSFWERRIDAMYELLADPRRRLIRTDELRRAIESLGPDAYTRGYYERWLAALARLMVEKGVVSDAELAERIAALRAGETKPT